MNHSPDAALPKVSVAMITYNHEKFIAQAIESVLMQQVDFEIEIIIGEDCSTDATRDIVRRYAESYPGVIFPVLHKSNCGVQRNLRGVLNACRGQYIACLEGDDYWTDPGKLRKQVALMDENPNYSMCGTGVRDIAVSANGEEMEVAVFPTSFSKTLYNLEDVLCTYPFRTLTFMLRNRLVSLPDWFEKVPYGDLCLFALYGAKGPVAYMSEITGNYRMHGGGIFSGKSNFDRCAGIRKTLTILNTHFSGEYSRVLREYDFQLSRFFCHVALGKGDNLDARRVYYGSFRRFAAYKPFSYFLLGLSVFGWHRLKKQVAVRTRLKRMLKTS